MQDHLMMQQQMYNVQQDVVMAEQHVEQGIDSNPIEKIRVKIDTTDFLQDEGHTNFKFEFEETKEQEIEMDSIWYRN